MEVVKTGLFRAAYFMYANTSVGYYYHSHNLATAEKKFKSIEKKGHQRLAFLIKERISCLNI